MTNKMNKIFNIGNITGCIQTNKQETKTSNNYLRRPICDEVILDKKSNQTPKSFGGRLASFIISNLYGHSAVVSKPQQECSSTVSEDNEGCVNTELNSGIEKTQDEEVNSVEPLTEKERLEILKSLNLTDDYKSIAKSLEKYDDDTFLRTVELIKNNGECSRHSDYSKIQDLNQEQFEKAKKFLGAGKNSFNIPYACDFAQLEEDKYEKLLKFRASGGGITGYNAQELYSLNDAQFEKSLTLVPYLYSDEWITPIVKGDDNYYYENTKNMLESPVFEKLGNYQAKYKFISQTCNQDEQSVKSLMELIKNGYRVTKDEYLFDRSMEEIKNMTETQRNRAVEVTSKSLASELATICRMAKLEDDEYQRAVELRKLNIEENEACRFSQYDEKTYSRIIELINKGINPNSISWGIEDLSDEEYEKITKAVDAGVKKFYEAEALLKEDDVTFSRALEMASYNVPGYNVVQGCKLSDYKHEIEKLKVLSSKLNFEKSNDSTEELPQISEEEKADIVKLLNQQDVYVNNNMSTGQLAYDWKRKYITGVNALPNKYVNKLLPYACSKYKSSDCKPLARWMYINDLDDFISKFPKEGEIYQTPRIQSFAKTQMGAEQYRGNNFSDTNTDKNVKFIVYPKSEMTQAYDTGEGKYGCDEAIYKADQKFKVLYKETQDLKTHKLYTIYMQEV
ncbi:MAG: hypothetical protein LUH05_00425 [Candidatus Gastranaerophilales bacterium]|nr:hypothetical protein [Candidatus Gastranaerophilales bacterium]